MKCKCGAKLASYGNYKELKMCADCGKHYVILQDKPRLISKSRFRTIRNMIDRAEGNKEELKKILQAVK